MRCLRLLSILFAIALLAACSGPRPRPRPSREPLPPPASRGLATPNDILFRAIGLVGTPYHWGGNTPDSGFDCSGLVVYVFHTIAGIDLPRTTQDMYALDLADVRRDRLQSGDLVFFQTAGRSISHVGIYVGEGRFVHAPNEGGTVRLDFLNNPYWDKHFGGAKRVAL
jgi:cell wall-associated NlpC family hydrolase